MLAALCLISTLLSVTGSLVLENKNDYRLNMDQFLRERVDSQDFALNLRMAKDWLSEVGPDFSSVSNDSFVAHANFLALNKIQGGTYCDSVGRSVLEKNLDYQQNDLEDFALNGWFERPAGSRFDGLVYGLSIKHAQACRPVFRQMLLEVYPGLDKSILNLMDDFTDRVIESSRNQPVFVVDNAFSYLVYDKNLLDRAYDLIAQQKQDKDVSEKLLQEKKSVSYDTLVDLVQKYIVKPCTYYYDQTKHIFDPSSFDESLLQSEADTSEYSQLYKLAATKYTVCARVASSQNQLQDWLIDGMREIVFERTGKKIDKPLLKRLFKKIRKDEQNQ